MNRSRVWARTAAIGAAMAIIVGACGVGGASPSAAPATPGTSTGPAPSASEAAVNPCGDAPVNLSIWGGYAEMDAVFKKAGESYKTAHPNVDLTIFSTDLRGFEQKLTTALPSKTAGDIITQSTNFLTRFADEGLLAAVPADLETYTKSGAFDESSVVDSTYKDKLLGVPLFIGGTALYYNKDMFAEAGLTDPPTSMDQIIEYAKKLAKLDGDGNVIRSGLSLRLSGQGSGVAEKFWILLLQSGKGLLKETAPGKYAADYNGPEGAKLLTMYVDFLKNKVDSHNIEHDAKAFETLATAMLARESWVVADIALNAPDLVGHYGTVSLPVGETFSAQTMFVPEASPNAACAWDFIKFLTEQPQQLDIPTIAGWIPARADLDLTAFLSANPGFEGFLKKPANFTKQLTPPISEFDELETKLATHLVDAYADFENLSGNPAKIQALLDTWAAETNEILKTNGHF